MPSTRRALTLTIAMTVLPIQVATAQSVQLDPADDSAAEGGSSQPAASLQATENRILHLEQQVEELDILGPRIESLDQDIQSIASAEKASATDVEALNDRLSALETSAQAFIESTEARIDVMAERFGITAIPLDQSAIEAAERVAESNLQDEDATDTPDTPDNQEDA